MKNVQDYESTVPLKCVITLTQPTVFPSHQTLTSMFMFSMSLIQLQEKNKKLLNEVENDIMKCRDLRSDFNNCFVIHFFKQPGKGDITQTRGLRN